VTDTAENLADEVEVQNGEVQNGEVAGSAGVTADQKTPTPPAAEAEPLESPSKNRFSRTRNSSTETAPPTDSLRAVMRTIDMGSLRWKIVGFSFVSLVGALSQAILLLVISGIVLAGVQGKQTFHTKLGLTLSTHGAITVSIITLVLFFVTTMISTFLSTSVSTQALTKTRGRLVTDFFRSSWALQSGERLGHLQQLMGMNSSATASVVGSLSGGFQALLMVCALLGLAIVVDPIAALAVLVLSIALLSMLRPLRARTKKANRELSRTTRAMATRVTEYTRLSRDFRLFGVESRIMDKLDGLIEETGVLYRRTNRIGSVAPILYQTFALGIVIVGIILLTSGGHQELAKKGIVLILVLRSVSYGASLQGSVMGLRAAQGLIEDLTIDLRRFEAARITPGDKVPDSFEVDFDDVEYSYDGVALALRGVSMHIPEGRIVGMLGPSGSGKTTISQILLGLREPTSGKATIGGVNASEIAKTDAHSTVALVPQEPVLLQGTVSENIKFFRDFEEWEVIEASKAAHLHEDVTKMPDGYDTLVGEGGGAVSGGQKQRLAIARALIGRPNLMVLDEPTSAVDQRTDRLIRKTLSELRDRVTVVIISHRIETTAQCDLLLVLANGKIEDYGERDAILAGSAYQDIVLSRH
jgi:ATP-binding cassette, subfamily B, bacterial